MMPDAFKVLIYAVWQDRFLVFDEPDFPDQWLQVPGGTIEPGEAPDVAAAREFFEETELEVEVSLQRLMVHDYRFPKDGREICHRRHYFLLRLTGEYPASWIHLEEHSFDGGGPIRFRFSWMSLDEAARRLGGGMGDALPLLLKGAP
ncbi:NUDIX domain-containing protein [Rhizobium sp. XQZ8]|uniref:NUDIX hydrolase n=1 Tax=Rhizobium populisoli TaxID=2859785 RepID=UPI001CA5C854|nr:NUDIX domain-containing protein [Rhizobium populisoli]MBW6424022.1 NUDIX domain-containing protein [Rhizobium populisoli]